MAEELAVVALFGSMTLIGKPVNAGGMSDKYLGLEDAVVVWYDSDEPNGRYRLLDYHLPPNAVKEGKQGRLTLIPHTRVDYVTTIVGKDNPIFAKYEEHFIPQDEIIDKVVKEHFAEKEKQNENVAE